MEMMLKEKAREKRLRFELVHVTPEVAERFLEKNHSNRKVRESVVDTYAKDMTEGRWEQTHQGIAFDSDGNLMDGQHRLMAIVKSGVSLEMIVAHNVESRVNIDNHAKRNLTDTTGWNKYYISMAKTILDNLSYGKVHYASSAEILDFMEKHKEHLEFALELTQTAKLGLRVSAVKSAFFAASYHEDKDRLIEFANIIKSGVYADYSKDGVAIMLREWLMSDKLRHYRSLRRATYLMVENAIRQFCKGKVPGKLQTKSEPFYIVPESESESEKE
jgi:hypothetical protein